MEEETNARHRTNPAAAILLGLLLLLVLYIASLLPIMFAINHAGHRGEFPPVLDKIYSPFGWARTHTFSKKPIEKYGDFLYKI